MRSHMYLFNYRKKVVQLQNARIIRPDCLALYAICYNFVRMKFFVRASCSSFSVALKWATTAINICWYSHRKLHSNETYERGIILMRA